MKNKCLKEDRISKYHLEEDEVLEEKVEINPSVRMHQEKAKMVVQHLWLKAVSGNFSDFVTGTFYT